MIREKEKIDHYQSKKWRSREFRIAWSFFISFIQAASLSTNQSRVTNRSLFKACNDSEHIRFLYSRSFLSDHYQPSPCHKNRPQCSCVGSFVSAQPRDKSVADSNLPVRSLFFSSLATFCLARLVAFVQPDHPSFSRLIPIWGVKAQLSGASRLREYQTSRRCGFALNQR